MPRAKNKRHAYASSFPTVTRTTPGIRALLGFVLVVNMRMYVCISRESAGLTLPASLSPFYLAQKEFSRIHPASIQRSDASEILEEKS